MIKQNRRLFRYSFIKFICIIGIMWLIFLVYVSTWNTEFFSDVNKKFSDVDVRQIFKGRLVGVIEKRLNSKLGDELEDYKLFYKKGMNQTTENINSEVLDSYLNIELSYDEEQEIDNAEYIQKSIPKPLLPSEILRLHTRLNLTSPGHMGAPVLLPEILEFDIVTMVNKSKEKYQINEFISNLIPLDRELPDIRTEYCKNMTYSKNLPTASIVMVFHNEALSMILRSLYAILNRSPEHLLKEIVLVDDCSDIGN